MIVPPIKKDKNATLIADLFYSATVMHLAHLKSQSYAEHVALNEVYDMFNDAADDVCETLQGYVGILNIEVPAAKGLAAVPFLLSKQKEYTQKVKDFEEMPDIQNKLQDVLGTINKTIYKLKNLK